DGKHGNELWMYDGVSASLVVDIIPGSGTPFNPDTVPQLTVAGDKLFFVADDGNEADLELWSWNGSSAAKVTDINPRTGSSKPFGLTSVGLNALYFVADDGTHGRELWMTYVDSPSAVMVKDINSGSGSSNPGGLIPVGNSVYFSADDGTHV